MPGVKERNSQLNTCEPFGGGNACVPLILVNINRNYQLAETGKLADIAPTILDYLEIEKPLEMTGNSLLISTHE